jgi:hypothetical protein
MGAEDGALQTQPGAEEARQPQNGQVGDAHVEEDLVADAVAQVLPNGDHAGNVQNLEQREEMSGICLLS